MTDKEVRKLSKEQLIEILYLLSQENDKLREENAELKTKLDAIVEKLAAGKELDKPASASAPKSSKSRKKRR